MSLSLLSKSWLIRKEKSLQVRQVVAIASLLMLFSGLAHSVDNPDLPDLVAEFESRERPMIDAAENATGYRDGLLAYTSYLEFLDKELNTAYKTVRAKLPEDKQQQLKLSQVSWLKYRDLEFNLIENTWTKDGYGTSSSVARGQHKAAIVRARIIQLMHYTRSL